MAYTALTAAEVAAGAFWKQTTAQKIKDNLEYLYGQAASFVQIGIPNGSFEIDSDADGVPDNWTVGLYSGGTKAISAAIFAHGLKSMSFTHPGGPGNGGGYIESDYLLVSLQYPFSLSWVYYCTAAGMKCAVEARWYDAAQAYLSSTTVYTSTSNPTSWKRVTAPYIPPVASTVYVKLRFIIGYIDTDVAGSGYLDDVQFSLLHSAQTIVSSHVCAADGTAYSLLGGAMRSATENDVKAKMTRAGIFRYLFVEGADALTTVTLRVNGGDTALTVTDTGSDLTHLAAVQFGDLISWKVVNTTSSPTARISVDFISGTE